MCGINVWSRSWNWFRRKYPSLRSIRVNAISALEKPQKIIPCSPNCVYVLELFRQKDKMESELHPGPIAPHRGFNEKSRKVLIGSTYNGGMPKSASEFDLRKKFNGLVSKKKGSNGSSPQSQSSVSSIPENAMFDTIGERPTVKKHMKLGDVGKTRSCVEFKTNDKRLLRTFQEDNIIKMPSMDSDMGNDQDTGVADLCLSFEGLGKSLIYSQSDDNATDDVKDKKKNKK
ncbi:Protein CBG14619 [Caenorhabditis briggsae]|uniref:Protein CBG14619 n=2 Tax=Caenorhabditis briggsae TaxID=6238 RepID=A8XKB0_CAEBR|nr:Protein CBG14619 [Caenorhabditis briggsae]ULT82335.1 hypothetical protein L3Y34_011949 [Caenorhabditis briggsae]CAP33084.2 Protein CBG14619 [Caenorhabditis briggsae]